MSNESSKGGKSGGNPKSPPATSDLKPSGRPGDGNTPVAAPVANLFRQIDWITFGVTALLVFTGYFLTLAPNVTLEDSGELATGSFYAGVPHPPGYPVWTIFTWLFTVLVPVSNIAYRVGLASAVSGALASGLIGLLVSRGSSLILEGIADLKNLDRRWENWLCLVSGYVAGMLLGFNGFMWSQAVIVEVYPFSVLSFMGVLCCLLRWMYALQQRRYLYWAMFLFGICFTNHQTLIVAAMGIEVAIMAAQPRLGRDLFLANALIYLLGLVAKSKGVITAFDGNPPLFFIFNAVGLSSAAGFAVLSLKTRKVGTEWKVVLGMAIVWGLGAAFYFYMPLASMTNPPMNWGYPRTKEGFWHALTRGQYDKTNPTSDIVRLFEQIWMYVQGAIEEFNFVYLLISLVPFLFYRKMNKRERAWLVGLTAIYLCLAALLMILLNPSSDRQSREQNRVFFTASHVIVAMGIGYGLSLIGAVLLTQYERYRKIALWAALGAAGIAVYGLADLKNSFKLDLYNALFVLGLALAAVLVIWSSPTKARIGVIIGLFALMPVNAILGHWADNEQRGHLFGFWFGHDMFRPPFTHADKKPIYPEMPFNTVLFGGTDPGRFNPTYMIFCESFIPGSKKVDPTFDRRDVYLITQNALADGTYLSYIRAHYNRSTQIDPPFFVNFFRSQREEEEGRTNLFAKMFVPLDRYFTALGAQIEARRRKEGVYPMKEISTPSPKDSEKAFSDYIAEAQRRLQHDMQAPNEPKQIKPGEDVRIVDNRVSVSGQVAVMAINGLLTKVIFDNNPTNEFYVEESFPLDWMFPHLTPYGIIMKINRQPVPEITDSMVKDDHEFWSQYSSRFIGNWITYDTPVKDVCQFAEKVYLRRDFSNFKGDPKFVRDDNAQKAFSKLRSAIGGIYFWRLSQAKTTVENQRMVKEADFAFKQSFAFCPYSPEAVYKYVNLLINVNRSQDAQDIVRTAIKFDPENLAMHSLLQNIEDIRKGQAQAITGPTQLAMVEQQWKSNPSNLQLTFQLASMYLQMQRTNEAVALLDKLLATRGDDAQTILSVAQAYVQVGNGVGLVGALEKLVKIMPDNPESWYDLARAQAALNRTTPALESLTRAITLSNVRLVKEPKARNLQKDAATDPSFAAIRQTPDFLKVISAK
jgi:tetratricopeptide (TPR) repeat protein